MKTRLKRVNPALLLIMSFLLIGSLTTFAQQDAETIKAVIKPQRASLPSFNEIEAAATLIKNSPQTEEAKKNILIADSWRQQKKLDEIEQLKLQTTKKQVNQIAFKKEALKLEREAEKLKVETRTMNTLVDPTKNVRLSSIYADRQGNLKATLYTKSGHITVQNGYQVEGMTVAGIGQQHIVLKQKDKLYSLYIN